MSRARSIAVQRLQHRRIRTVPGKAGSCSPERATIAAHDALLQGPGGNVQWAAGVFSGARRFSHYKVKAQQTVHGTTSPASSWQGAAPAGSAGAASPDWAAERTNGEEDDFAEEGDAVAGDAQIPVQTEVEGTATDPVCHATESGKVLGQ